MHEKHRVKAGAVVVESAWSAWVHAVQLDDAGDHDDDGVANRWEDQYGLDPLTAADRAVDLDGDGRTTVEEFIAETIPTDSNSYFRVEGVSLGGLLGVASRCGRAGSSFAHAISELRAQPSHRNVSNDEIKDNEPYRGRDHEGCCYTAELKQGANHKRNCGLMT